MGAPARHSSGWRREAVLHLCGTEPARPGVGRCAADDVCARLRWYPRWRHSQRGAAISGGERSAHPDAVGWDAAVWVTVLRIVLWRCGERGRLFTGIER